MEATDKCVICKIKTEVEVIDLEMQTQLKEVKAELEDILEEIEVAKARFDGNVIDRSGAGKAVKEQVPVAPKASPRGLNLWTFNQIWRQIVMEEGQGDGQGGGTGNDGGRYKDFTRLPTLCQPCADKVIKFDALTKLEVETLNELTASYLEAHGNEEKPCANQESEEQGTSMKPGTSAAASQFKQPDSSDGVVASTSWSLMDIKMEIEEDSSDSEFEFQ